MAELDPNRQPVPHIATMNSKQMKRYSTPTDNREMHIKMSIGHHTLSIMGKVKKLIIPMVGNVGKWPLCLQMTVTEMF